MVIHCKVLTIHNIFMLSKVKITKTTKIFTNISCLTSSVNLDALECKKYFTFICN
jgi:hypothetical protein